ncbi:MAG: PAS domain S-box protein [Deltaproteobacteria bacterium]|nr:PAS domain S-box protein [Deltaproteobacteria bacterium]
MVSSLIPALVQRLSTPVNHYCGKLFPATALPFSSASILAVQTTQPLHWIIDSVPVLALFLIPVLARMKRSTSSSRPSAQGEASATKLTQAVTELKAELAKQRRAEETLRASEEFYRNLVENTNDGIATISLEGTVTSVNRGFEHMLGRIREEIVEKHYSTILSIASLGITEDRIRRFQAGEKLSSLCELELLHHNGNAVRVEVRTRAITDKNGTAIGFQGVYRDVSKRAALKSSSVPNATAHISESDPAHHGTTGGNTFAAPPGSSTAPTEAAMPPWSQLSSPTNSNADSHYPAGYSPLSSHNASTPSTPPQQHDFANPEQNTSPFSIKTPGTSTAFAPAGQTPSASSPQFRFTNGAGETTEASAAPASPSMPSSSTLEASQFTLSSDRQKKDERQAKVVPFPAVPTQGFPIPPQLGSANAQQIFDLDEALNRVDGDRELLREMAAVFLDEYPLLLTTMQDALSHGNAQTLTFAVHTLKGSVANFAANNAFEAALKLEKIGRQGNLTQAKTALAEMEAELARLAPLLTTLKMEAAA